MEKPEIRFSAIRKRLNRWLPKLTGVTMSRIYAPVQNCITIRLGDFIPYNMRSCLSNVHSASFVGFWQFDTPRPFVPIVSINTSKDVVSRKDVPFGGAGNEILHCDPILPKICHRKFWAVPPEKMGPKNFYIYSVFRQLQALMTNICWTKHDRQSGKCVGRYEGSSTLCQNFMNFGPQTA